MRRTPERSRISRARKFIRISLPLLCILAVAIAVRVWKFGGVPPGLNQDEASTAYDAFSLLRFGIDRNGFPFPVVLVSWGSGMYSLASLLAIPSIALLGLNVVSARLPTLIVAILTIIVFFDICRRIDKHLGLIGAAVLAISPWHIMLSRWGLDSNFFPAVLLLAMWALVVALSRKRTPVLAPALFALSLYAYGTAYFVVPLFVLSVYVYLAVVRRLTWRAAAIGLLAFGVVAAPVLTFIVINQYHLPSLFIGPFSIPQLPSTPRFSSFPIFGQEHILQEMAANAQTLWHVLLSQDDGTLYNVLPGFGYAYFFGAPFILMGFLLCVQRVLSKRTFRIEALMLGLFFVSLLLGLVMSANVNRINCIFLPLLFFLAVGIHSLQRVPVAFAGVILAFLLSFGSFVDVYFTTFPESVAPTFFASFGEAIDDASRSTTGPICVTDNVNMPYIFVLFARQFDPRTFLRTAVYDDPHAEFRTVTSFDRYTFGLDRCDPHASAAFVMTNDEATTFVPDGDFSFDRFSLYTTAIRRTSAP